MSALRLVAGQELLLASRSRWTQIFAVVFAGLALAVAASGYVLSGGYGVQDFARTAASLVQLVLLLVPLTSVVIGVLSLAGERGASELLFSQPVARGKVRSAGVIMIGPIPIIFGTDKKSVKAVLALALAVTIVVLIVIIVNYWLLR